MTRLAFLRMVCAASLATAMHAAPSTTASDSPTSLATPASPTSAPASGVHPGERRSRATGASRGATPHDQAARRRTDRAPFAPLQEFEDGAPPAEIEMFVGESRVFPAPGVSRIAVGNGALLTAAALDNNEVILFANGAGTSSLFIWNAQGQHQRVKISIVPGDASRFAREIAAFLSTIPKARASLVGANIIVEGDELSDADIAKVEELAKRYPQIVNFTNRLGWEQMVMLDVRVIEFPVTVLRELGLKWSSTGGAALAGIWAPARRGGGGPYEVQVRTGPGNGVPITGPNGAAATLPSGLNAIALMNLGLNAQLDLLVQEGTASLLADPHLSARSGSKASFLAGGEIPYTVSTRDGVAVQFKTYGVKLDITPRVDRKGVIRATIQTEVSGLDRSVSTPSGPALLSRKTETEFNLRNGETIVLSGLLQREQSADVDKVPLLGDIPVLGAIFRSRRFQNRETELVVFVTPTVVDAQSAASAGRIKRATERLERSLGEHGDASDRFGARSDVSAADPTVAPRNGPFKVPVPDPSPVANLPAATSDPRLPGGSPLVVVAVGVLLRAEPDLRSAGLLPLVQGTTVLLGPADPPAHRGDWRNVVAGSTSGWVPAQAVEPRTRPAAAAARAAAMRRAQSGQPNIQSLVGAGEAPRPASITLDGPSGNARQYRVGLDGLALRISPDPRGAVLLKLPAGDIVTALPRAAQGPWTAVQAMDGDMARRGWVAAEWLLPLEAP
ncbi:MAG TPA: pilus assembly protein N-terminal domain-containing protein [Albitalea sp.]|uniref:pilus assembly protein N-terminal domain-containing protein n=1 Tax=Piscinibacter sp. TaxID=1903157 RepID=UPI002ED05479